MPGSEGVVVPALGAQQRQVSLQLGLEHLDLRLHIVEALRQPRHGGRPNSLLRNKVAHIGLLHFNGVESEARIFSVAHNSLQLRLKQLNVRDGHRCWGH